MNCVMGIKSVIRITFFQVKKLENSEQFVVGITILLITVLIKGLERLLFSRLSFVIFFEDW